MAIGIRGDVELARTFRALAGGPSVAQRRRAREKAMLPVRDVARAALVGRGAMRTGALWLSLGVEQDQARPSRTLMGARTGIFKRQRPSSYQHLVELGTRPHFQPNRFGGIMHPGARPKPHIRVAHEAMPAIAPGIYAEEIAKAIQEAAARSASRQPRRRG